MGELGGWGLLFSGDGGRVAVRGRGPNDRQSWADEMNMNKNKLFLLKCGNAISNPVIAKH
jgi:hypothetical protein